METKRDLNSTIRFFAAVMTKTVSFVQHLDSQANILIGLSSAIFLFSATSVMNGKPKIFLIFLAIFSAASAITALLAVHPPRFMRKRGQKESLMYNKKMISFKSPDDYARELNKILEDNQKIVQQFSTEIYNLNKYYYSPKRRLYSISRNLLLLGIFITLLMFLAE